MEEQLRQREKSRLLRVTMPDGEVICYNKSLNTFIEVLKRIGSDKFPLIDLKVRELPFFSKEIYPQFKNTMKEVCDGWYVIITGGTPGLYLQLRSIAKQLGINLEVELGDNFITQKTKVDLSERKRDNKLLVKFPNGEYAAGENPIDTLIDTIWQIGPEVIKRKEIKFKDKPIITSSKMYNGQIQVGQNLWLTVPVSTKDKYRMLRIIDSMMRLGLEINII